MSDRLIVQYGGDPLVLIEIPGDGHALVRGTSVPADAATGYAKGCIFIKTNGGVGTTLYVNEGTKASCDFNAK